MKLEEAFEWLDHPLTVLLSCLLLVPAILTDIPAVQNTGWFFLGFNAFSFIVSVGRYARQNE